MSLQAPLFLLALLLVPAGVLVYLRRERGGAAGRSAFASPAMLPSVAPQPPAWRRHAPLIAYAVALVALIVALSRPQVATSIPIEQARILLVTDQSNSMTAEDVSPTRLDAAVEAEKAFANRVPHQVQIGAITFNKLAKVISGPTTDRQALTQALDTVTVKGTRGGTNTGDAIERAIKSLQTSPIGLRPPPAAIVLLSDGKATTGEDPLTAAANAKKAHIPIYSIVLGTADGFIPKRNALGTIISRNPAPADPSTLQKIAEITDAQSFQIGDSAKLTAIYEKLGSQLSHKKGHKQITAGFAGGGLALVLLGAGMSLFWFGRVP